MTGDHCVLQAKDTDLVPLDGHIISRNNTAGGVGQWGGETYVNDVNHLGVFPQDAWTAGEAFKIAYCYAANDGHVAFNGRLAGSPDTSGSLPPGTVDQLRLGTSVHGKNPHYGHFLRLRYFDRRVANATLQSLTTL